MENKQNRAYILISYSVMYVIMSYLYCYHIANIFAYDKFLYSFDSLRMLLSIISLLVLVFVTPYKYEYKFSVLFYHLTLIFIVIPMAVLYAFAGKSTDFYIQSIFAYILIILLPKIVPYVKSMRIEFADRDIAYTSFILAAAAITIIIIFGGMKYFNLDFTKVYELREISSDNLPGIFTYLLPVTGKVFLPIAFILFVNNRKYTMAFLTYLLSIILFGLTTHKAVLFYPILSIVIYKALKSKLVILKLQTSINFIVILSTLLFLHYEKTQSKISLMIGSLLFRRTFILPADLNYAYYDFFSNNPFIYWSNSKITLGLIEYPYSLKLSNIIGLYRMDNVETGANTGWIGSGYAQAGFLGIFVYSIIISTFIKTVDRISYETEDETIITAGMIIPSITLITSSDLTTSFFTHGLGISIIIIMLFNKKSPTHLKQRYRNV